MKKKLCYLMVIFGCIAGCASMQSISLTQIPADRAHRVEATTERFIFLAFNFDNDYVDVLTKRLKDKCPNGRIQGILTKDEIYNYVFAHKRIITARGYCVR